MPIHSENHYIAVRRMFMSSSAAAIVRPRCVCAVASIHVANYFRTSLYSAASASNVCGAVYLTYCYFVFGSRILRRGAAAAVSVSERRNGIISYMYFFFKRILKSRVRREMLFIVRTPLRRECCRTHSLSANVYLLCCRCAFGSYHYGD